MIKIRNKRIALLLVLTMLATMFVGVGTASAATNYWDVDSTWSWIPDDEATPDVATITLNANDELVDELDFTGYAYVEVTLPDGVEFDADPTIDEGFDADGNASTDPIEVTADTAIFIIGSDSGFSTGRTIQDIDLDVDEGITGSISANVRIFAYEDGELEGTRFAFDEEEKTLLAKISSSDVTVTAKSAKSMYIGGNQKGADITVKEVGPGAFGDEDYNGTDDIKLVILTGGVTWEADGDQDINAVYTDADFIREDGKVAYIDLFDDDAAQISRVILTPFFKVAPNATGEVKVKVSGENIETETFVIGNVKDKSFAVEVENAEDDWVYRGQIATFDDVKVNVDTKNTDLDSNDWFSIALPDGVKFAKIDEPVQVDSPIVYEGRIKSDSTVWFSVDGGDFTGDFDITDFVVIADANAVVGDLKVTFAGAVEGEYVIGSVKDAFTAATTPVALQAGLTGVDGNDIVITETEDGAMAASGYEYTDVDGDDHYYDWFSITLPAGITWDEVPTVKVTDGDIDLGEVDVDMSEDFRVLWIEIEDESNVASEITISDIKYNILSQPALGEIVALIGGGYDDDSYNIASSKPLVKLTVGTVAINPTAVYVIGAPTFTVNGAVQSVVTPSYIKNGRTFLAIRDIATGLGIDPMNVLWDAASSKVTLIKGTKIVQVQVGSNVMNVNGVAVAMDVAPEISNGRSMLPAAFIAQAFGATASWDAATQTVTIK